MQNAKLKMQKKKTQGPSPRKVGAQDDRGKKSKKEKVKREKGKRKKKKRQKAKGKIKRKVLRPDKSGLRRTVRESRWWR
jgi:hypothetical protein